MVVLMVTAMVVWMDNSKAVVSAVQRALRMVDSKVGMLAARRAAKTAGYWAWTKVEKLVDPLVERMAAMWDGLWAV